MIDKIYLCIDLKSFYASVECIERKLDPLKTFLVVADNSRTDKTICLASTPALKQFKIGGRSRLFEVKQKIKEVNHKRLIDNQFYPLKNNTYDLDELLNNKDCALDVIIAKPQMALYIQYSAKVYECYLKYFSKDDIYTYSIDEVFIDISKYLKHYNLSPYDLAKKVINDVFETVKVTATCGIGTNTYLAKVAMDVLAKKIEPDANGDRIAILNEISYRELLWTHKPLTDFWRVGKGYSKKLEQLNLYTMGDIAMYSLKYEEKLYKLFGVNAELLIDHAWGYEICTIEDIKGYKPSAKTLTSGQVLHSPYNFESAKIVVAEMAESLSLQLVEKGLLTSQIVLSVGYDIENITDGFNGEIVLDPYGRKIPKQAHKSINLSCYTSSTKEIVGKTIELYDLICNKEYLVRRLNMVANNVKKENEVDKNLLAEQLSIFDEIKTEEKIDEKKIDREKNSQLAIINIKNKYGKNAILKLSNLVDGSTAIERNSQIGGHKE